MTYKPEPFNLGRPPHLLAKDLIKRIEDRLWEQGVKVSLGGRHIDDAAQMIHQIYEASDYATARASAFTEAAKACEFAYLTADNGHQVMADYATQQTCIATIRNLASQAEEK